jgi:hypothetical protein
MMTTDDKADTAELFNNPDEWAGSELRTLRKYLAGEDSPPSGLPAFTKDESTTSLGAALKALRAAKRALELYRPEQNPEGARLLAAAVRALECLVEPNRSVQRQGASVVVSALAGGPPKGERNAAYMLGRDLATKFISMARDPNADLGLLGKVYCLTNGVRTDTQRREALLRDLLRLQCVFNERRDVTRDAKSFGRAGAAALTLSAVLVAPHPPSDLYAAATDKRALQSAAAAITAFLGNGAKWDAVNEFFGLYGLAIKTPTAEERLRWTAKRRNEWEHPLARLCRDVKAAPG